MNMNMNMFKESVVMEELFIDLFIVHLKTWSPLCSFMMDLTVQLKNSKGFCKLSVKSVDGWGGGGPDLV